MYWIRSIIRRYSRREYMRAKDTARALVHKKLIHFNSFYGFEFNRISIRNQRSRWGSCSRQGNLNFNYKVVFLPEHLVDYIIVHELCHLKEMNHSPKFWNLVAQTIPDHKVRRKQLRGL